MLGVIGDMRGPASTYANWTRIGGGHAFFALKGAHRFGHCAAPDLHHSRW